MKMLRITLAWLIFCSSAIAQVGQIPFWPPIQPLVSTGSPMVTPFLVASGGTGAGPSTTVQNFAPAMMANSIAVYSTTDVRGTPIAVPGTINTLSVRFPSGVGTGSYTITLDKNAVATALTCTISSGTTCSDSTHSASFAAGDTVSWSITPASSPTSNTAVQISALFTGTNNGESFIMSPFSGSASATLVNFMGFSQFQPSTTEANASSLVATGGTIDQLYAVAGVPPGGAGKSYNIALCHNGACTSSPNCNIINAATTCNDLLTSPITVAAGDTISLQITPTSTPAAASIWAGLRWTPTIPGEALVFQASASVPSGNSNQFTNLNGSGVGATEANFFNIAESSFTLKKLRALQSTAPGGTASRAITVRAGSASVGTPGNLSCTITSAITACNDPTNSYTAATNDLLDLLVIGTNTPAVVTFYKTGAVMTVP